jgi:regulator of sigma E protease
MEFLGAMGGATGSLLGYPVPFLAVLTSSSSVTNSAIFSSGAGAAWASPPSRSGSGPEIVGFNDRRGTRWKLSAIRSAGYVNSPATSNSASVPDADALSQ